jgi:hypothetical protein
MKVRRLEHTQIHGNLRQLRIYAVETGRALGAGGAGQVDTNTHIDIVD